MARSFRGRVAGLQSVEPPKPRGLEMSAPRSGPHPAPEQFLGWPAGGGEEATGAAGMISAEDQRTLAFPLVRGPGAGFQDRLAPSDKL